MNDSGDNLWQRGIARLVLLNLERVESEIFISSLPSASRETLRELIRQWMVKQSIAEQSGKSMESESDARLCWAVHTGRTAHELLGDVVEINNVGELIDVALSDNTAEAFGGWVEPIVVRMLLELLPLDDSEDDISVCDQALFSAQGRLSSDRPFVILRIAKMPSLLRSEARRGESRDDSSDLPQPSSLPPPVN